MTTTLDPTPRKKRKVKELPLGLSEFTKENCHDKIKGRYETDPKEDGETKVACEAMISDGKTVDLTTLTIDQLRKFCRNVGVSYVNKCTKFQCRKALMILAEFQSKRQLDGRTVRIPSDNLTSNIIRITNILFSDDFLDSFLKLNDAKKLVEHGLSGIYKDFWGDVAEAMNGSDDDDSSALKNVISTEDAHYEEIDAVDLERFDLMTPTSIKMKVSKLFKVRKLIKTNMAVSGEHDSDPYNFVEVAMSKIGKTSLSVLGCYYFFIRCDSHPEVDVRFTTEMDDSLKGNTITVDDEEDTKPISSKQLGKGDFSSEKVKAYNALVEISNTAKSIASAMNNANRLAEQTNRLAEQAQLISVAQALGRTDVLEKLLQDMSASNSSDDCK